MRDKIIINSELGGEGNDYFMVPRVILAMKLFGLDKATIDKVCYQNPEGLLQAAGGLSSRPPSNASRSPQRPVLLRRGGFVISCE